VPLVSATAPPDEPHVELEEPGGKGEKILGGFVVHNSSLVHPGNTGVGLGRKRTGMLSGVRLKNPQRFPNTGAAVCPQDDVRFFPESLCHSGRSFPHKSYHAFSPGLEGKAHDGLATHLFHCFKGEQRLAKRAESLQMEKAYPNPSKNPHHLPEGLEGVFFLEVTEGLEEFSQRTNGGSKKGSRVARLPGNGYRALENFLKAPCKAMTPKAETIPPKVLV